MTIMEKGEYTKHHRLQTAIDKRIRTLSALVVRGETYDPSHRAKRQARGIKYARAIGHGVKRRPDASPKSELFATGGWAGGKRPANPSRSAYIERFISDEGIQSTKLKRGYLRDADGELKEGAAQVVIRGTVGSASEVIGGEIHTYPMSLDEVAQAAGKILAVATAEITAIVPSADEASQAQANMDAARATALNLQDQARANGVSGITSKLSL